MYRIILLRAVLVMVLRLVPMPSKTKSNLGKNIKIGNL